MVGDDRVAALLDAIETLDARLYGVPPEDWLTHPQPLERAIDLLDGIRAELAAAHDAYLYQVDRRHAVQVDPAVHVRPNGQSAPR